MAKVVLEGVSKVYPGERGREVAAVENLSLTIHDREFVVLVGPSGCGKSTTLRMIAGLEAASKGDIYLDDRRVNGVAPKDRDIAMVFQNYALYPHMTVRRNMAFGLELRKYPKAEIEKRVREAAALLGLSGEMLDRKPRALSGGERQRVAVGRAIVRKPKAFLFDEPLSNLDAKMRVQMRTEISKLHTRLSTTMIYVTHDQVEAMTMGDRIVVMKDGRIQQVAEPLEIYHQPANAFVGGFIGSPPMNFLEGTLAGAAGHLFFVGKGVDSPIRLRVFEEHERKLAPFLGKEVVFGIRPEDLEDRLFRPEAPADHVFPATVEVVEPMGAETYLYLNVDSHPFVARAEGYVREEVNRKINLVADMKKAHFFESPARSAFPSRDAWQAACARIV